MLFLYSLKYPKTNDCHIKIKLNSTELVKKLIFCELSNCIYSHAPKRSQPANIKHSSRALFWTRCFPVAVPPDIVYDDTSGDLSVSEGENATLWCRATGHPPPRITWKREDGQPIIIRKGTRDTITGRESPSLVPINRSLQALDLECLCWWWLLFMLPSLKKRDLSKWEHQMNNIFL